MTQSTEQERAEFEAWWRGYTKSNKAPRFEGGAYIFPAANTAWNTWQAARRAPSAPTRKQIEQYLYEQGAVTVSRDVAEAAGLARLAGKMQSAPAAPVPQSEPVAYLWQHCETGRTRVVMPDMVITADANWIVVGPLYLAAAPQSPEAALVPSIAVTPEMVEAANEAYCPFGDMELALCAALQVAPIPPGAAPVQLPENLREGEPYDNPAFEALARALGVWGTAQSAVCAQFWIAAKEQST